MSVILRGVFLLAVLLGFTDASHAAVLAPGGVIVTYSGTQATLSWNVVPGATGYAVRIHKAGTPYLPCESMVMCKNVQTTSVTFVAEPGVTYDVWVHGMDVSGLGPSTGTTSTAPAGAALRNATITWLANLETDLAGYKLYRAVPCGTTLVHLADYDRVTSAVSPIPDAATEVEYAVTAFDTTGNESQPSARICKALTVKDVTAPASPAGVSVIVP